MQLTGTVFVCECVFVAVCVCVCVRSGPLLYMVQVMILGDFMRFAVITISVILPLAAALNWRFEGSSNYYNFQETWWSFMQMFVDPGSSHLICISQV